MSPPFFSTFTFFFLFSFRFPFAFLSVVVGHVNIPVYYPFTSLLFVSSLCFLEKIQTRNFYNLYSPHCVTDDYPVHPPLKPSHPTPPHSNALSRIVPFWLIFLSHRLFPESLFPRDGTCTAAFTTSACARIRKCTCHRPDTPH